MAFCFDMLRDSGFLGSKPTHFELLDSLVSRFVAHNFILNPLLRAKRAVKNTFSSAVRLIGSVFRRFEVQIRLLSLLRSVFVLLPLSPLSAQGADAKILSKWQQLVRTETWTGRWPDLR